MYKQGVLAFLLCLIFSSALLAQDGPTVNVYPSLAPNVYGSLSYPTWESNAIAALQSGAASGGDNTLPSFYQQIPNGSLVNPWLVSEFPSWLNQANPGTVFGPAFAGELGNRMYFNLHIVGNGQRFSLSQVAFQASSTDVTNFLGYTVPAGTYNYGSGFVGLNYGPNNIKGDGDDFLITGGANTQLFDELFARGSGNANAALLSSPGVTDQEKLDNTLASMPAAYIFQGTFTLDGTTTGSAFVVVAVPEPATIILTSVCGAALGVTCWRYRKRRRIRSKKQATQQAPAMS
ncbi:MAG: hypothetical protein U0796_20230 [Gemmatales bacterium]